MEITFYLPEEKDLSHFHHMDPDKDWKKLRKGQRWTVQTFLRLKQAGNNVALSNVVPQKGIFIYQQRHKRGLKKILAEKGDQDLITICIRGDKSESLISDFEVVQNDRWDDNTRFFYIPYWPQPGLIPRKKDRGPTVEVVAFKGFHINLHPYFFSDEWENWLKEHGFTWRLDSQEYAESEEHGVRVDWHDYREVDIILAMRPDGVRKDEKNGFTAKPATKLYNAWHAGVPAILPPEYAYSRIRESPLDFAEVQSIHDVKESLLSLKSDPVLYREMVENGLRRAEEYTTDKILAAWEKLLYETIPQRINEDSFKKQKGLPLGMRILMRRFKRYAEGRTRR